MQTFVTIVFGTPGGMSILEDLNFTGAKEEFQIDVEKIVFLSKCFRPSRGSFSSTWQLHLQQYIWFQTKIGVSCPRLIQGHLLEVIFNTLNFHFQTLEGREKNCPYHQLGVQW